MRKYPKAIPCVIMRGGTSKGLFFLKEDLPFEKEERDRALLAIMGSPDVRQINGLGGAASVTSKVAILSPSERPGIDVEYTFAQVSVDKPIVSYEGNCGNISSAVAPFAIKKGLVSAKEPYTEVRIWNTNTRKVILSKIRTEEGEVVYQGDFFIPGVPSPGSPIKLSFLNPVGTLDKGLLPTGNVVDHIDGGRLGEVVVSMVDAANPLVFVRAETFGLTGTELPRNIDSQRELLEELEMVRGKCAVLLNLCHQWESAKVESPAIPKLCLVAPPQNYETVEGKSITAGDIHISARMMSMQKTHPTYAMTGAMCTTAASVMEGTVVWEACTSREDTSKLLIGHPGGVMESGIDYTYDEKGNLDIRSLYGFRTANLLMEGLAYYSLAE